MKAVKCPVCNGKGTIKDEGCLVMTEHKCHGCDGKGWVQVSEDFPPKMPKKHIDVKTKWH